MGPITASAAPPPPAIRRATVADASALAAFGAHAFRGAFGAFNRPEDVIAHVRATYGEERQRAELADPATVVLIAERGATMAGYAFLRPGTVPQCVDEVAALEIARLYVDQCELGRGVGAALMTEALAVCESLGARTVWLTTWEKNARPLRFYEKHGFRIVGTIPFMVGADRQRDYVLARSVGRGHG